MKKSYLLLISYLLSLASFSQTTYYVDGVGGSNTNPGTSLGAAWKTIQNACNNATPGSTVLIKGGTYNEYLTVNVSGTAGNPITFKNYMNDSVFIDGTGTPGIVMLYINNKSYLNFNHLVLQNLTINNAQGILVVCQSGGSSTNISFSNITVRNINWTGSAATVPTSNDNAQAIIVYGYGTNQSNAIKNLTIDSCYVYNNILGFSEAVSLDGNIDGFSITNCKVHDNTNIGIDITGNYMVSSNPALDHARHGLVSGCECYRNFSNYATSGGIYVDGGWSTVIDKCKLYENGWGIEVGCEENGTTDSITVKNNLIYNNKEAGIAIGGYTNATTGQVLNGMIRNNTFFGNNTTNTGLGEIYMTKMSNTVIQNNIFYTNAQNQFMFVENISPQANNILDYNDWFSSGNNANNISVDWRGTNYSTFSLYKSGTGQEVNSFYANPSIFSTSLPDLHPTINSPSVDAGNLLTTISSGETDYDGYSRIMGPRINCGAYETNAVGIETNSNPQLQFSVYPNPATNNITINCTSQIKIYDVLGNEVLQMNNTVIPTPKPSREGNLITIDISEFPSGIYTLHTQNTVTKFVKE